jgi:hypothetical protein
LPGAQSDPVAAIVGKGETQSSLMLYTPLLTAIITGATLPWSWTIPASGAEWWLLAGWHLP